MQGLWMKRYLELLSGARVKPLVNEARTQFVLNKLAPGPATAFNKARDVAGAEIAKVLGTQGATVAGAGGVAYGAKRVIEDGDLSSKFKAALARSRAGRLLEASGVKLGSNEGVTMTIKQAYIKGYLVRAIDRCSVKQAQQAQGLGSPLLSQLLPGYGPAVWGAVKSPDDRLGGAMRGVGGSMVGSIPGVTAIGAGGAVFGRGLAENFKALRQGQRPTGKLGGKGKAGIALTLAGIIATMLGGAAGTRRAVMGPERGPHARYGLSRYH